MEQVSLEDQKRQNPLKKGIDGSGKIGKEENEIIVEIYEKVSRGLESLFIEIGRIEKKSIISLKCIGTTE